MVMARCHIFQRHVGLSGRPAAGPGFRLEMVNKADNTFPVFLHHKSDMQKAVNATFLYIEHRKNTKDIVCHWAYSLLSQYIGACQ